MHASLRDLQRRFAASLAGSTADTAVYRNTVAMNCRNALAATYPVVRALTGAAFFHGAVDAFCSAHPSTGGDLNVYGGELADFLATYPHAQDLPFLPDIARLEWAIDEASRAPDTQGSAQDVLAALASVPGDAISALRFTLEPSCRLVRSRFPVMRIWRVHQSDGDKRVDLDAGADHLVVRREGDVPSVARIGAADFAFLAALADGANLRSALDAALAADGEFDLAAALRACIADGTIAALR
jgi:hypothetical protein